jgi:hypothetical protein
MATPTTRGSARLVELHLEVDPEASGSDRLVLQGQGVVDRGAFGMADGPGVPPAAPTGVGRPRHPGGPPHQRHLAAGDTYKQEGRLMEWQLLTRSRAVTVVGLLVGALGIAILWAAGVEFPDLPAAGARHPAGRRDLREPGPVAMGTGRGSVPGAIRARRAPHQSHWTAQPVRGRRNRCRHRPTGPGGGCTHRADRGRDRHAANYRKQARASQ